MASTVDCEQVNANVVVIVSITSRIGQDYCFDLLLLKNIDRKVYLGACQIAMTELFNNWKLLTIFAKIAILNLSLKYFVCMLEACESTKNQLLYSYFPLNFVHIVSNWLLSFKIPKTIYVNTLFDGCFFLFKIL